MNACKAQFLQDNIPKYELEYVRYGTQLVYENVALRKQKSDLLVTITTSSVNYCSLVRKFKFYI